MAEGAPRVRRPPRHLDPKIQDYINRKHQSWRREQKRMKLEAYTALLAKKERVKMLEIQRQSILQTKCVTHKGKNLPYQRPEWDSTPLVSFCGYGPNSQTSNSKVYIEFPPPNHLTSFSKVSDSPASKEFLAKGEFSSIRSNDLMACEIPNMKLLPQPQRHEASLECSSISEKSIIVKPWKVSHECQYRQTLGTQTSGLVTCCSSSCQTVQVHQSASRSATIFISNRNETSGKRRFYESKAPTSQYHPVQKKFKNSLYLSESKTSPQGLHGKIGSAGLTKNCLQKAKRVADSKKSEKLSRFFNKRTLQSRANMKFNRPSNVGLKVRRMPAAAQGFLIEGNSVEPTDAIADKNERLHQIHLLKSLIQQLISRLDRAQAKDGLRVEANSPHKSNSNVTKQMGVNILPNNLCCKVDECLPQIVREKPGFGILQAKDSLRVEAMPPRKSNSNVTKQMDVNISPNNLCWKVDENLSQIVGEKCGFGKVRAAALYEGGCTQECFKFTSKAGFDFQSKDHYMHFLGSMEKTRNSGDFLTSDAGMNITPLPLCAACNFDQSSMTFSKQPNEFLPFSNAQHSIPCETNGTCEVFLWPNKNTEEGNSFVGKGDAFSVIDLYVEKSLLSYPFPSPSEMKQNGVNLPKTCPSSYTEVETENREEIGAFKEKNTALEDERIVKDKKEAFKMPFQTADFSSSGRSSTIVDSLDAESNTPKSARQQRSKLSRFSRKNEVWTWKRCKKRFKATKSVVLLLQFLEKETVIPQLNGPLKVQMVSATSKKAQNKILRRRNMRENMDFSFQSESTHMPISVQLLSEGSSVWTNSSQNRCQLKRNKENNESFGDIFHHRHKLNEELQHLELEIDETKARMAKKKSCIQGRTNLCTTEDFCSGSRIHLLSQCSEEKKDISFSNDYFQNSVTREVTFTSMPELQRECENGSSIGNHEHVRHYECASPLGEECVSIMEENDKHEDCSNLLNENMHLSEHVHLDSNGLKSATSSVFFPQCKEGKINHISGGILSKTAGSITSGRFNSILYNAPSEHASEVTDDDTFRSGKDGSLTDINESDQLSNDDTPAVKCHATAENSISRGDIGDTFDGTIFKSIESDAEIPEEITDFIEDEDTLNSLSDEKDSQSFQQGSSEGFSELEVENKSTLLESEIMHGNNTCIQPEGSSVWSQIKENITDAIIEEGKEGKKHKEEIQDITERINFFSEGSNIRKEPELDRFQDSKVKFDPCQEGSSSDAAGLMVENILQIILEEELADAMIKKKGSPLQSDKTTSQDLQSSIVISESISIGSCESISLCRTTSNLTCQNQSTASGNRSLPSDNKSASSPRHVLSSQAEAEKRDKIDSLVKESIGAIIKECFPMGWDTGLLGKTQDVGGGTEEERILFDVVCECVEKAFHFKHIPGLLLFLEWPTEEQLVENLANNVRLYLNSAERDGMNLEWMVERALDEDWQGYLIANTKVVKETAESILGDAINTIAKEMYSAQNKESFQTQNLTHLQSPCEMY